MLSIRNALIKDRDIIWNGAMMHSLARCLKIVGLLLGRDIASGRVCAELERDLCFNL